MNTGSFPAMPMPPELKEEIDKTFSRLPDGARRWWLLKARNRDEAAGEVRGEANSLRVGSPRGDVMFGASGEQYP